jgi:hypothetical protein
MRQNIRAENLVVQSVEAVAGFVDFKGDRAE